MAYIQEPHPVCNPTLTVGELLMLAKEINRKNMTSFSDVVELHVNLERVCIKDLAGETLIWFKRQL